MMVGQGRRSEASAYCAAQDAGQMQPDIRGPCSLPLPSILILILIPILILILVFRAPGISATSRSGSPRTTG